MNDEFLYRLRKDPPPAFAARLKSRLKAQSSASARRHSFFRTLVLGLLIGGSAVGSALWAVKGAPGAHALLFGTRDSAPASISSNASTSLAAHPSTVASDRPGETTTAPIQASVSSPASAESSQSTALNETSDPQSASSTLLSATAEPTGTTSTQASRTRLRIAAPPIAQALVTMIAQRRRGDLDIQAPTEENASRLLCTDHAQRYDIVIATRALTNEEIQICRRNGIRSIAAAKIGYYAVVLTAAKTATALRLSAHDVYLALAKQIPNPADSTQLIDNPNITWDQVNSQLERRTIVVFGPAQGSPLSSIVSELILAAGCDTYPWIKALKDNDIERYRRICHTIREDGLYVATEQSDLFITQRLWAEPSAIALLGFNFFDRNREKLIGSLLHGPTPTLETLDTTAYSASTPLYVYANNDQMKPVSSLRHLFLDLSGEYAMERNDYRTQAELTPLPQPMRPEVLQSEVAGFRESAAPLSR